MFIATGDIQSLLLPTRLLRGLGQSFCTRSWGLRPGLYAVARSARSFLFGLGRWANYVASGRGKRTLLRPLTRNLRLDFHRHGLHILLAGSAHCSLDSLCDLLGFVFINFDNDLIVNDVHDLFRSLAQFIV